MVVVWLCVLLLLFLMVIAALLMKVLVLFYCRCLFGVYLYQEKRLFLTWDLSALLLVSVKFDFLVSSDILFKSLFTKFLFASFLSLCISFNGFLGSTVSGVWIVTDFSADFDESNNFITSFFSRSLSRRKYISLSRLLICSYSKVMEFGLVISIILDISNVSSLIIWFFRWFKATSLIFSLI